jgi:hypothetical protein
VLISLVLVSFAMRALGRGGPASMVIRQSAALTPDERGEDELGEHDLLHGRPQPRRQGGGGEAARGAGVGGVGGSSARSWRRRWRCWCRRSGGTRSRRPATSPVTAAGEGPGADVAAALQLAPDHHRPTSARLDHGIGAENARGPHRTDKKGAPWRLQ